MRGSIRARGLGRWQIQIYDQNPSPDGKVHRHYETVYCKKKSEAQLRLTELLANRDKGIPLPIGHMTVASNLRQWFDGYCKTQCSTRTQDGYKSIIELHLIPALGNIKLKELERHAIQKFYGQECEKLSAVSVHHFHRVLSQSLKYAVRQGFLGRNPAEMVDPPSPRSKTMRALTNIEVETLLETAAQYYYYPVFYTAVSSGLRQAELCGLRWRDLDLRHKSISVNRVLYKRRGVCEFKEPKTDLSRRRVSMTTKLASYLRTYKAERESMYTQLGSKLTLDDLVFPNVHNGPIEPAGLSREFKQIVRKCKLGEVRFHDLRHTFASALLLEGVNPKIVSEALGHSNPGFTMSRYSHIIGNMQQDAMALLNKVLPKGNAARIRNNGRITAQVNITQTKM